MHHLRSRSERWQVALALVTGTLAPAVAGSPSDGDAIELRGRLTTVHTDDFERGVARYQYWLSTASGIHPVIFDEPPGEYLTLPAVRVRGRLTPTGLRARDRGAVVIEPSPPSRPLTARQAPVERRVLVIPFYWELVADDEEDGLRFVGPPETRAWVEDMVFLDPLSTKEYFEEVSFYRLTLDGDVTPWLVLPGPRPESCSYTSWTSQAEALAITAGYDPSAYDNLYFIWDKVDACSFSGVAFGVDRAGMNGTYNFNNSVKITAHELGHNFGASHSRSRHCTDDTGRPVPISTNCTWLEYGDSYCVMGADWNPSHHARHFSNYQKGVLSGDFPTDPWMLPENTVQIDGTSVGMDWTSYELQPIETPTEHVNRIRIDGSIRTYYLEYRTITPFDNFEPTDDVVHGVTIRWNRDLLDMHPETANLWDAPLAIGETFTEPDDGFQVRTGAQVGAAITVSVRRIPFQEPNEK